MGDSPFILRLISVVIYLEMYFVKYFEQVECRGDVRRLKFLSDWPEQIVEHVDLLLTFKSDWCSGQLPPPTSQKFLSVQLFPYSAHHS